MSHDDTFRRIFGITQETAVRRIVRTFERATPSDVESGARWYDEAGALAADLDARHALEPGTAARVISALSPRTPWTRNVAGAVSLLANGTAPGCIGANVARAINCINGDDLTGPKTRAFAANISGDREAVTVDVWAMRVIGLDETALSRKGAYDAVAHAYRLAARRCGVDPATTQATTWIVARNGRAS